MIEVKIDPNKSIIANWFENRFGVNFDPENDNYAKEWYTRFREQNFDILFGHMGQEAKEVFVEVLKQTIK